jgi:hypothetical protein
MVAIEIPSNSKVNSLTPSQINNLVSDNSNSSNDILLWISAIALILALGSLFYLKKVPKDYQIYQYILIIALAVSTLVLFLNKSKFSNNTNNTNNTKNKRNFGNIVNSKEYGISIGNTSLFGGEWIYYLDTTISTFDDPARYNGYTGFKKTLINCSSKSLKIDNPTPDTSTLSLPPKSILSVAEYPGLNNTLLNSNNEKITQIIIDNDYITGILFFTEENSEGNPNVTYAGYAGPESPYGELFLKMASNPKNNNGITISPNLVTCKNVSNSAKIKYKKSGSDCINIDGIDLNSGIITTEMMNLLNNMKMKIINYTKYDYIIKWGVEWARGFIEGNTAAPPDLTKPQRVKARNGDTAGEVFTKLFSDIVTPKLGGEYIFSPGGNNFISEDGKWSFFTTNEEDSALGTIRLFDIPYGGLVITDITGTVLTALNLIGMKQSNN